MKEFIRNHFEEFANRNNLRVGEVHFTAGFVDHGADVPPGLPTGPAGAIQYVGAALKQVSIEDLIAEDDKCGAQPLDRHRSSIEAAVGIFWNCNLEDCRLADRGALSLPGESALRAQQGARV